MLIRNNISETRETFNITTFSNHKGLYYKSRGLVRTLHTNWDLVTYLNIDILTSRYDKLMTQYNTKETICKQIIDNYGNSEIENTCNQFVHQFFMTTLPYYLKFRRIVVT